MNRNLIITIILVASYLLVSRATLWFSDPLIQQTSGMNETERTEFFDNLTFEEHTYYDIKYASYVKLKFKIYSILFFFTFLFILFNSQGLTKSLAMFALFLSFASMIDKVFYNFYKFKASDYIVITAGVIGGLYVHLRARD